MHRTIEASVPASTTAAIVAAIENNPHVMGLTVLKNASLKPQGDVIQIHLLNKGADDVLRVFQQHTPTAYSVVTSEVASINDPTHQHKINDDIDEAIWEELETSLRHNGSLTKNYLYLMAFGGIIVAVGLVSELHNQVIAFVSASVIAPGLEPLAKIPLGFVLKNKDVLWAGIKSTLAGYLVLILAAAATFLVLLQFSEVTTKDFTEHPATASLEHLKLKDLLITLAAAAASIIMYLSYRRHVIAGPLIALVLIPAAAALGMGAAMGDWHLTKKLAERLAIDTVLVLVVGLVIIFFKQMLVHKRHPLR